MTIFKVSALAGAGKTHFALRNAVSLAQKGEKVLFVQPTTKLAQQSQDNCRCFFWFPIKLSRIDSTTVPKGQVISLVSNYLKDANEEGQILFITHETFFNLPYFNRKRNWHVIVDEVPSAVRDITINLPKTHALLTSHLKVIDVGPFWCQVIGIDSSEVIEMSENRSSDDLISVLKPIAQHIVSETWSVFVRKENWYRVLKDEQVKLELFAALRPRSLSDFASVTVMSAMLEDSVFYRLWERENVEFEPHPIIQSQVEKRLPSHTNGDLLTIKFFCDQDWSKRYRDQGESIDGHTVSKLDFMREKIARDVGSEQFLWVANNDVGDDFFNASPNAIRISNSPHGLNEYQAINSLVFLSALNPSPSFFRFLDFKGVSPDELRDSLTHQVIYQAVMRTSLRDPESSSRKTVIVPDGKTAEWLSRHFPNCSVEKIEGISSTPKKVGRPSIASRPMSSTERSRRSRHTKKLRGLFPSMNQKCNKTTIKLGLSLQANKSSRGTFFATVFRSDGDTIDYPKTDQFIEDLKKLHQRKALRKDNNNLICPAVFDPKLSDATSRGLENVVYANGIWLDNDGGDLNHNEFRKLFPDIQMVCFNTFSGGGKYRVYIPTKRPISTEEYSSITGLIIKELNQSGYLDEKTVAQNWNSRTKALRHGFDLSKLHAASLFYLPCQTKRDDENFFIDFSGNELDPDTWISAIVKTQVRSERQVAMFSSNTVVGDIEGVVQGYRSIPPNNGRRNAGFFKLGCQLQRMGLNSSEISHELARADYDGSRKKKNAIKSVLNSLKSGRYS